MSRSETPEPDTAALSGIPLGRDYMSMDLNALLDVDVVSLETEDQVSVLLELVAPALEADARRMPGTLQVVLDRSGSMGDGRLDAAKEALEALIARLDPADNFGLVAFDDQVQVVVPAGSLADKEAARRAVRSLDTGAMTNLSAGYLRGIQEARRAGDGGGATLLLLSDGHANQGVTDRGQLERMAGSARGRGITTSTIGIGLGYDEALMATVAGGGGGNTHFAEQGDTAGAAIAAEADELLEQVVQAASLTVRPSGDVSTVRVFNDLPAVAIEDGFMVELGDFYAGEERRLLLQIDVPTMPALGLAQVCELELTYVDVSTLDTETVTIPVSVNVVPGDEAAGRVPDPTVRSELAFQSAQRAKREASEAMRSGDADRARQIWTSAADALDQQLPEAPAPMHPEIADEATLMRDLAARAEFDDSSRLSKLSDEDWHMKMRKRGRRRRKPGS